MEEVEGGEVEGRLNNNKNANNSPLHQVFMHSIHPIYPITATLWARPHIIGTEKPFQTFSHIAHENMSSFGLNIGDHISPLSELTNIHCPWMSFILLWITRKLAETNCQDNIQLHSQAGISIYTIAEAGGGDGQVKSEQEQLLQEEVHTHFILIHVTTNIGRG